MSEENYLLTSCSLAVSPVKADILSLRLSIFFLSIFAKITIPNNLKKKKAHLKHNVNILVL